MTVRMKLALDLLAPLASLLRSPNSGLSANPGHHSLELPIAVSFFLWVGTRGIGR
jgi:hypothetical protein